MNTTLIMIAMSVEAKSVAAGYEPVSSEEIDSVAEALADPEEGFAYLDDQEARLGLVIDDERAQLLAYHSLVKPPLFDAGAAERCERTNDADYEDDDDEGCKFLERGVDCWNAPMDGSRACGCRPKTTRLPMSAASVNWPAVRAYLKATRELDREADLARQADHAVCPDGYGTRGLEDAIEVGYVRVAMRIAPRFGLTSGQLRRMADVAGHVEFDFFMQAMQGGGR